MIGQRQSQINAHFVHGTDVIAAQFRGGEKPPPVQGTGFSETEKAVDLLQRNVAVVLLDELVDGLGGWLAAG